jgi:hypothetical protein
VKKGDLILYLIIGLIAIISFMAVPSPFEGQQLRAIIEVDGQYYDEVLLKVDMEPREIAIQDQSGRYNVVEIYQGRVRMKGANCPDQVCVKMGWVSQHGHTIVCLPNRVLIRLKGQGKSEVDIVP